MRECSHCSGMWIVAQSLRVGWHTGSPELCSRPTAGVERQRLERQQSSVLQPHGLSPSPPSLRLFIATPWVRLVSLVVTADLDSLKAPYPVSALHRSTPQHCSSATQPYRPCGHFHCRTWSLPQSSATAFLPQSR